MEKNSNHLRQWLGWRRKSRKLLTEFYRPNNCIVEVSDYNHDHLWSLDKFFAIKFSHLVIHMYFIIQMLPWTEKKSVKWPFLFIISAISLGFFYNHEFTNLPPSFPGLSGHEDYEMSVVWTASGLTSVNEFIYGQSFHSMNFCIHEHLNNFHSYFCRYWCFLSLTLSVLWSYFGTPVPKPLFPKQAHQMSKNDFIPKTEKKCYKTCTRSDQR